MKLCVSIVNEAFPGVLGNRGIRPFISGKLGNKSLKLKGTGEQGQFWETGNIENQDFYLGNTRCSWCLVVTRLHVNDWQCVDWTVNKVTKYCGYKV